jgi:hypothetical protein
MRESHWRPGVLVKDQPQLLLPLLKVGHTGCRLLGAVGRGSCRCSVMRLWA